MSRDGELKISMDICRRSLERNGGGNVEVNLITAKKIALSGEGDTTNWREVMFQTKTKHKRFTRPIYVFMWEAINGLMIKMR